MTPTERAMYLRRQKRELRARMGGEFVACEEMVRLERAYLAVVAELAVLVGGVGGKP